MLDATREQLDSMEQMNGNGDSPIDEETEYRDISALKLLENTRMVFQKNRIQMGNRAAAVMAGRSQLDLETILRWKGIFEGLEDKAASEIHALVKEHEMADWFDRVKGIGPGLAGMLLAHIDIERADMVSKLWKYAGQAVSEQVFPLDGFARGVDCLFVYPNEDSAADSTRPIRIIDYAMLNFTPEDSPVFIAKRPGEAPTRARAIKENVYMDVSNRGYYMTRATGDRRIKGQKLMYNAELKKICYLIGTSFLRSNSPYRREYDEAKEYYRKSRPFWNPLHIDLASRRKMVKLFLSHFWEEWRRRRGLPYPGPYPIAVLGHTNYKDAEDYLLPVKA